MQWRKGEPLWKTLTQDEAGDGTEEERGRVGHDDQHEQVAQRGLQTGTPHPRAVTRCVLDGAVGGGEVPDLYLCPEEEQVEPRHSFPAGNDTNRRHIDVCARKGAEGSLYLKMAEEPCFKRSFFRAAMRNWGWQLHEKDANDW